MSNEEMMSLVKQAQDGDNDAMETVIKFWANSARKYLCGRVLHHMFDDALQTIRINIWRGINSYKPRHDIGVFFYFTMLIRRGYITFLKSANRQKNMILNDGISLNKPVMQSRRDGKLIYIEDVLPDKTNIEDTVIGNISGENLYCELSRRLTQTEKGVLDLRLGGWDRRGDRKYIEQTLGMHAKAVDNALSRVKRKLKAIV